MKSTLFWTAVIALLSHVALGATVFEATFDDEPPDAGPPSKMNIYGNELADRGVTRQTAQSGDQSAYIVADFTMADWGVIMLSDSDNWDFGRGKLSAYIRSSTSFMGKKPVVGFKLIDGDGTGYRTAERNLKTVSTSWTPISEFVEDMVPDEDRGEEPGLDLQHIVQYGIIFFDRQDNNRMVTFFIDDLKGTID